MILHTVDVQWENTTGLGVYVAFLGRAVQGGQTPGGRTQDFYDWGAMVQMAYLIDQRWEPFVRYDYTGLDEAALLAGSEGHVHEITVGLNYYFRGHLAKFTIDAMWLPNGSPADDAGSGVLRNDGRDEVILRGQFQLLI